jgi:hypothetical protein
MSRIIRNRSTHAILAASLLALAGCSTGPTAPTLPAAAGGASPGGTGSPAAIQHASTDGDGSTTLRLVGERGGVVSAGRFHVSFPPGAVHGTVTVTLVQPDPAVLRADLSVFPAVTTFLQPVTVVADCNELVNPGRMKHNFLMQLDPATGDWQPLPDSQSDLMTGCTLASSVTCTSYKVENQRKELPPGTEDRRD